MGIPGIGVTGKPICIKCASCAAEWDGPRYQVGEFIGVFRGSPQFVVTDRAYPDCLVYTCRVCGWARTEPCRDAEEKP